ncbi:3-deoxy-D-manno-octulosonic acid transferase, partial [Flavobacterium sp. LBUM151]
MKVQCKNCLPEEGIDIPDFNQSEKQTLTEFAIQSSIYSTKYIINEYALSHLHAKYIVSHINKTYGRCNRCVFDKLDSSKQKIEAIGFHNVIVSGDTRFDRVNAILERDNSLAFIENFKNNQTTIVIGSSWSKDEVLLTQYINEAPEDVKFIIAPHNIKADQISA